MNQKHSRPRVHLIGSARITVAFLSICLLLSACGAAVGGESSGAPSAESLTPLEFTTASLPDGSAGVAYSPTALATRGGSGEVDIRVATGALPPGLFLAQDGRLLGTPTATGLYEFTAEATDGAQAAARNFAIAVDHFAWVVDSGLRHGHAWSGREVVLRVTGTHEPVDVQLISDRTAGRILRIDDQGRRIVYVPGHIQGAILTDVLRATLPNSGASCDISLRVAPDPLANHLAAFGSTDVWLLEFGSKRGAHPYATDFQASLAQVGLRSPASTDRLGSPADRLAEEIVRKGVLSHLCTMFLRSADGSPGSQGLPISFTQDLPEAGYQRPAPGGWLSGGPQRYSVMAFVDGSMHGIVGTALTDSANNNLHIHNAPGASGELGVFINRVTEVVSLVFTVGPGPLTHLPVREQDIPDLEALLYNLPGDGARYEDLRYMLEGMAKSLAGVAAHEIGHSLGLPHTNPTAYGSLMNAAATIHPLSEQVFLPEDIARLRQALPGPGRTSGSTAGTSSGGTPALAAQGVPMGGVNVCRRGECNHR